MALGEVADGFGDFVQGACVASLSHRHDVRVGIASGMHLRERVANAPLRLEVLSVVYLCYWKWPAAGFLKRLLRRVDDLLGANPLSHLNEATGPRHHWATERTRRRGCWGAQGRARLYEQAWEEAWAAMSLADFSVVCHSGRRTVELVPRAQVRALGGTANHYYSYNSGRAPSKRRAAVSEFAVLTRDVRSGRLADALAKVAAADGAALGESDVRTPG